LQRVLDSGRDVDLKRNGRRIIHVEGPNVRNDGGSVWAVYSVDTVNVAAAEVRADEGDQYVRGLADERDIDRATEADRRDRLRQTVGERRDRPSLRIDARNPADCAFGDVERTIGTDSAARSTL
jgi:hypothetical protein